MKRWNKAFYLALPAVLLVALFATAAPASACSCPSPAPCCECGCTYTPGYWKTHSSYGPAPLDSAWSGMEDDIFYLSGQTIYDVLWTPPQGNAYYILAFQYISARFNIFAGASPTIEVLQAIDGAYAFFTTYAPGDTIDKELRKQILGYASLLEQYNSGIIGPGHCAE